MAKVLNANSNPLELQMEIERLRYQLAQYKTLLGICPFDKEELKGDQGEPGPRGLRGLQGEKGETGDKGDKGDKGDTGAQGLKGYKGDTGLQGIQGVKGDKGDKGDPLTYADMTEANKDDLRQPIYDDLLSIIYAGL